MSTTNALGLQFSATNNLTAPAAFIAFNWFYAYCILAPRNFKQLYGIDHNGNPRQDLNKYGFEAVKAGKLTQAQLEQIQRVESASANSTEGFILFTASVLFSLVAVVPKHSILGACTTYTIGRILYGVIYVFVADNTWSQARGVSWWMCNCSCLYLLWLGARRGG